jgi:Lipocalin-like domain
MEKLAGAWRLVEWTASGPIGVRHPQGADARGLIVYSSDGFMAAHLAAADGSSGSLSYCGSWELGEGEVVHHVELSSAPSFVGTDLVRSVSWEGDDLVLTTPPRDGWVNVLRWRRVAA